MRANELNPQLIIVMGGAGSGKNYTIQSDPVYSKYRLIDVDIMKNKIGVDAAIKQIIPTLKDAFEKQENVAHPTVGSNLKAQQNKINLAYENGYTVTLILVDALPNVAVNQVRNRVRQGGHDVEIDKIVSTNKKARENFNILKAMVNDSKVVRNVDEAALPISDPQAAEKYQSAYHSRYSSFDPNFDFLGAGSEAIVVRSADDSTVIKIHGSLDEIKNSGTMQYLLVSQKYAKQNPYLPRVLEVQRLGRSQLPQKQDKSIDEYYLIKLEELTPLEQINSYEAKSIFFRIFGQESRFDIDYDRLARVVWFAVQNPQQLLSEWHVTVKDKNFLGVANLIRKIDHSTDSFIDLHSANMMIRRTSTGPQLVITDPLARS